MKTTSILLIVSLYLWGQYPSRAQETLPQFHSGEELAQAIRSSRLVENFDGILRHQPRSAPRREYPLTVKTQEIDGEWRTIFVIQKPSSHLTEEVTVIYPRDGAKPRYEVLKKSDKGQILEGPRLLSADQTMVPLSDTDFWLADLGMEFFYWPDQQIVKTEMKRSCPCYVLDSRNPEPTGRAYHHVRSWIHTEGLGVVQAWFYDANNKRVKEFKPVDIRKIDGRWQVGELSIKTTNPRSRTTLVLKLQQHPTTTHRP